MQHKMYGSLKIYELNAYGPFYALEIGFLLFKLGLDKQIKKIHTHVKCAMIRFKLNCFLFNKKVRN